MISFGLHIDCLVLTFVLENYKNSNVSGRLVFTIKFCSATIFLWSFYSTSRIFWTFVVQGSVNWREKNHTAKLKELTWRKIFNYSQKMFFSDFEGVWKVSIQFFDNHLLHDAEWKRLWKKKTNSKFGGVEAVHGSQRGQPFCHCCAISSRKVQTV